MSVILFFSHSTGLCGCEHEKPGDGVHPGLDLSAGYDRRREGQGSPRIWKGALVSWGLWHLRWLRRIQKRDSCRRRFSDDLAKEGHEQSLGN